MSEFQNVDATAIPPAATQIPPQTWDDWFAKQGVHATWDAVATTLDIDRHTLKDLRDGVRYPRPELRERIFSLTGLPTYSPEGAREYMAGRPKKRNTASGTSARASHSPSVVAFNAWLNTQTRYLSQKELASAIGKTPQTIKNMASGISFPSDEDCEVLHEITGLHYYSAEGRDAARAEHRSLIFPQVKINRRTKYRSQHPKHDRADKGVAQPARWEKANDAKFIRSLLLQSKPLRLEVERPNSREIGRESRSIEDIAGDLELNERRVHKRLRRIFGHGLESKMVFAHGELLTNKWIPRLLGRFGVRNPRQLALRLRLEPRNIWNLGRRTNERALTAEYGPKLLRGECEFIAALMRHRGKAEGHFKAVVPDLRQKLKAAGKGIDLLRGFPDLSTDEQDRILNKLCAQPSKDAVAMTVLCWLPALLKWIKENQSQLERRSKEDLARDFVAHDYGIRTWIVQKAAYSAGVTATQSDTIEALLFPVAMPGTPPKPRSTGGRKKTFSAKLLEKGEFCARVVEEARKIKRLCFDGGKTVAEIRAQHPEFAIWGVREELDEESREVFNHPRQWGPVVGYAENILGKQQGKSPTTIREWVKAYRRPKPTN